MLATSWSKSGFFKLLWFIMSVFVMSAFNAVTNSYEMKLHQTSKQVVQLFLNWHLPTIIIWMSMALVTKYVVSACSIYIFTETVKICVAMCPLVASSHPYDTINFCVYMKLQ